ncbi:MAG: hypothetical protein CME62_17220 [Halobacteriovoraceae bacterium]|nr:hypothetical protein [Halobacteriovoraceae bacterium]|tara:strand:- start:8541 stop:8741 length:201 start_codon:yes stop_codon:yes gene_type:complete
MSNDKPNIIKILGIGLGLPSAILSTFFVIYYLIESDVIPAYLGLLILVVTVVYFFYLMIRFTKNKS